MIRLTPAPALAALLCLASLAAEARPARCTTSEEGSYACDFEPVGRDGSFRIAAPGKPTYAIDVVEPGIAAASVSFGARSIPLPGRYVRQQSGCWINFDNRSRICAQ